MTRPAAQVYYYNECVRNSYFDDAAMMNSSVRFEDYDENHPNPMIGDSLWFIVNVTAYTYKGFIYSISVGFSFTDSEALLSIHALPPWPKTYNLNIADLVTLGSNTQRAYASAICVDQPEKSSLEIMVSWHFLDPNNMSHWITASLETVYFNGTAYRKVIMPIQLGVLE
jgi:hypothetical protein